MACMASWALASASASVSSSVTTSGSSGTSTVKPTSSCGSRTTEKLKFCASEFALAPTTVQGGYNEGQAPRLPDAPDPQLPRCLLDRPVLVREADHQVTEEAIGDQSQRAEADDPDEDLVGRHP